MVAYNQQNVHLVDLKRTPIKTVTQKGIRLRNGTVHELDVLVYATGFNAITGAFVNVDWHGKDGIPPMGTSGTADVEQAVSVDYRPRT
ncbi:hypothetical protein BJX63DRAFT_432399 [Aspergillus granulosus]|uniref:FAD/NAD(P)-binding domain-containing protein n=1 Tax=Aspergillus granulosus TaxID=176169 RepID=A0ABR4HD36_9EURO